MAYFIFNQDPKRAEAFWKDIIATQPDHIGAHVGLIKGYAIKENISEFEKHVRFVVNSTEKVVVLKEIGGYCIKLELFNLAIEVLSSALSENSQDVNLLVDIATCYAKMGQLESAIIGYREALKIDPDNAVLQKNIRILQQRIQ